MELAEVTAELFKALTEINNTLDAMKAQHEEAQAASYTGLAHYPFYAMKDTNGRPLASDLLVAKANLLITLNKLKGESNEQSS